MWRIPLAALLVFGTAAAEPLPPGAIGFVTGAIAGTGPDAKHVGAGYCIGAQASWQPTTTERKVGWTLRWATMFGNLYGGDAALVTPSLRTVQMDLTLGLRARPWATPTRYLTLRGGAELLRSDEPIPPMNSRAFVGGIASIGLDQYISTFLFNVDVRYGLFGSGPGAIALILGFSVAGP